jgi:chromate transporter
MDAPARPSPNFGEAFRVWLKIGCLSFGGPAGQIALMHRVVVDEKKWIDEPRFLHALNFCMLLPGPEATELAAYIGWLLHGVRGGLVAGILFVLPGALVMLGLTLLYVYGRGLGPIDGALFGIKAAVLVIVIEALLRIGRRSLKSQLLVALAAGGFIGIYFFADRGGRRAHRVPGRAAGPGTACARRSGAFDRAEAPPSLAPVRHRHGDRTGAVVGAGGARRAAARQ